MWEIHHSKATLSKGGAGCRDLLLEVLCGSAHGNEGDGAIGYIVLTSNVTGDPGSPPV